MEYISVIIPAFFPAKIDQSVEEVKIERIDKCFLINEDTHAAD